MPGQPPRWHHRSHHAPAPQVFALADHVGTYTVPDVTTTLTNGGHLGLFMGREALETAWRPMFEKIAARSLGTP